MREGVLQKVQISFYMNRSATSRSVSITAQRLLREISPHTGAAEPRGESCHGPHAHRPTPESLSSERSNSSSSRVAAAVSEGTIRQHNRPHLVAGQGSVHCWMVLCACAVYALVLARVVCGSVLRMCGRFRRGWEVKAKWAGGRTGRRSAVQWLLAATHQSRQSRAGR